MFSARFFYSSKINAGKIPTMHTIYQPWIIHMNSQKSLLLAVFTTLPDNFAMPQSPLASLAIIQHKDNEEKVINLY